MQKSVKITAELIDANMDNVIVVNSARHIGNTEQVDQFLTDYGYNRLSRVSFERCATNNEELIAMAVVEDLTTFEQMIVPVMSAQTYRNWN